MFTTGGVLGACGNSGGGPVDPVENLLVEWSKPSASYASGTWVSETSASYEMSQSTEDNRPTVSGESLVFDGTNDELIGNAAARALLSGVDDYTVVIIAKANPPSQKALFKFGSGGSGISVDFETSGSTARLKCSENRSSGITLSSDYYAKPSGAPAAFAFSGARNGVVTVRWGANKFTGGSVADVAVSGPHGVWVIASAGSAINLDCAFHVFRVYAKVLDDTEWDALRAFFSDNADYGTTGVTL